tara:strand:- start:202 stop:516 length:315 start_codon:yes stop_codon:yes gene_type:complete
VVVRDVPHQKYITMKKVYALTVYDVKLKGFITTQHYSNLRAAKESFDRIKEHLIAKYDLESDGFKKWTRMDNGANITDVYEGLYNVSIVRWSVQKDPSTWLASF